MAQLKLAVDNTATTVTHPRPFQTMYYKSANDKGMSWSRIGRASSKIGAIRAATVRLVTGQYMRAVIHGEEGQRLYTITRVGRKIEIFGLFMMPEK